VNGELVGFAIVDRRGGAPDVEHNMAQFFVLRKFKRQGTGTREAEACFRRFTGVWNVMVIPGNAGAHACGFRRDRARHSDLMPPTIPI
jgi:ribosomal-protein-alanine N-acetyltransferase